ncbi:MAG: YfiR family protein [Myxococcales bacterium]
MEKRPRVQWSRTARACLLLTCLALPCIALAQQVPAAIRAAILLRSLSYEKGFAAGTGPATVLVLSGSNGTSDGNETAASMKKLATSGGSTRQLRVETSSSDASAAEAKRTKAQVVYVASGNERALSELSELHHIIVLCGDPAGIGKGCVLSVEVSGTSSRLVIDLARATKLGLQLDARILRLARVVR